MTGFITIPKIVTPRIKEDYTQQIPKVIWQTMQTNRVPVVMKNYADSWIDLNPEYEYRFYDDKDVINFFRTDFPEYLSAYNKLKFGASKADLWRYLIIYKYGGVYADMDCKCIKPLRQWIHPASGFVTQLGINKDICQWLIISVPNNPVFKKAAEITVENLEKNNKKISYKGFDYNSNKLILSQNTRQVTVNHEVLGLSGPPVLQKASEECFDDGSLQALLNATQVVCVSSGVSCQMNGNVKHDTGDPQYKNSYRLLKLKHYNTRWLRIKRRISSFFDSLN